ncbi:MAG: hypothetical protein MI919_09325 [Holophagales bacterium]|nr:hypothetical protein [Holophagales bacterium]
MWNSNRLAPANARPTHPYPLTAALLGAALWMAAVAPPAAAGPGGQEEPESRNLALELHSPSAAAWLEQLPLRALPGTDWLHTTVDDRLFLRARWTRLELLDGRRLHGLGPGSATRDLDRTARTNPEPRRGPSKSDQPPEDEPHEVDPDPLTIPSGPDAAAILHLFELEAEDDRGRALAPARLFVWSSEASPSTPPSKENPPGEPHEVDPDPSMWSPERSRLEARADIAGGSILLRFAVDHLAFARDGESTAEALLAWAASWLWPEAFEDAITRPHEPRIRLHGFELASAAE